MRFQRITPARKKSGSLILYKLTGSVFYRFVSFDSRQILISIRSFKRMFSIYSTLNLLDNSWGILPKFQP
ncbi:hypothetical protein BWD11_05475 [Leptospira santarosai serovar Grippotyphosa]|nr:hypothetical protein BWD11_05475 [Leptospira santarosai serovar Grippotyphosa]